MFCMPENKKYILLMFQNIIQIVKNKLLLWQFQTEERVKLSKKQVILLIISNREKREAKTEGRIWHYLVV